MKNTQSLTQEQFNLLLETYSDRSTFYRFRGDESDQNRYFEIEINGKKEPIKLEHSLQKIDDEWYWVRNTSDDELKSGAEATVKDVVKFVAGVVPDFGNTILIKKELRSQDKHIQKKIERARSNQRVSAQKPQRRKKSRSAIPPTSIEERMQSIEHEALILGALNRAAFWSVRKNKDGDNVVDFVTDRANGDSLDVFVKKIAIQQLEDDKFKFVEILKLAKALIVAFKEVQLKGVIHGDINSENIHIEINEKGAHACFVDFGSSNLKDEKDKNKRCGTPEYVAPEVFAPEVFGENYDGQISQVADDYAFGNILYELFTTRATFNAIHIKDGPDQGINKQKMLDYFSGKSQVDSEISLDFFKSRISKQFNLDDIKVDERDSIIKNLHFYIYNDLLNFDHPEQRSLDVLNQFLDITISEIEGNKATETEGNKAQGIQTDVELESEAEVEAENNKCLIM